VEQCTCTSTPDPWLKDKGTDGVWHIDSLACALSRC